MAKKRVQCSSALKSLVKGTQAPFLFLVTDFNYNTDGYDGDATDEHKSQDGSETMPFIDESPTMSPQLSARSQDSGDAVSPSPNDILVPGGDTYAEKGLEMRKLVLSGFLASEEIYINQLEALLLPMRPLKATATTSQPVLTIQQIETIFYKIQDIFEIHKEFYDNLYPNIQQWDNNLTVGHLFQKLVSFPSNVLYYTIKLLGAFASLITITYGISYQTGLYAVSSLLYKPIDRVTRSTLVLHDLLKHTPTDHPDYPLLQDALRISQNFLSSINEEIDPRRTAVTTPKGEARQLVKDGFLVELSEGTRKVRHVFLFTDLLLCAKMKKTAVGKQQQYDCKWYIPLADLTFQNLDESDTSPHIHTMPEHEIEEMKMKISCIKSEIQKEKKASKGQSRAVDRLKKKMFEQESYLLLHSPTIPFRIHNIHGKFKCFCSNCFLRALFSDHESSGLYGFLHVIVHSAKGFKESANLYCTLEVDSFGYFVSKAKTRVFRDTTEPQWNEEFEIELEGSQCLRILCYETCYDKSKLSKDDNEIVDKIMGKWQVQLDPQTVQSKNWHMDVIEMNGVRRTFIHCQFLSDTKDILVMLSEMDINAIAGTLKLYFRELPEPLLTDRLYLAFMEGIALSDPAAKENCMMHLLRSLPEPNLITFLSLLEHLKRVAEKEPINKMSLHNLGTVFGPTLLRPSEVEQKAHINLASDIWSHDVMAQLKRASSDDTLAKPGLGSALATSRMRKTVTTGAISELAEARPRGIPGSPTKHPVNGVILDNARPPVNCNPLKNSTSSSSDVTKGTPSPDSSEFENIVPSRTYSVSSGIGKGKGSGGQNTPHYSRELSMECLTEQIQKMEESHHSTAEELQATLQELSDQQQVVQELTAENERLATEKSLLQSSLSQQRERVEHLAQKNEGLMSRLQEQSQSEEAEARAARIFELEQRYSELVESSRFEREKLVDIQQQLTGSLRSLEKEHQESQGLIKSLKEEKEHIQRKLEAEEEANNKVTRRFEDCTANTEALKVENGKLKVQLDVEKQKVVELKAMQSASDNSELQNLLKAAHSEKERLDLACTELKQELLQASGEADRLQGMLNKVEVEHKQLQQLCDQQREQLSSSAHKLQERTCEKDSEIKDLKETIFELEDQVEQHRAVKLHNNQTIVDLETVVVANDIKIEAAQEVRALRRRLQEEQDHSAILARELQELQGSRSVSRTPVTHCTTLLSPVC
ncbi:UNVERIFIED_CONTAM: hypothetical protein FKN15_071349 [Acipenser sinensis]